MIYTRNAQEKSWLRWAVILLTVMVAPSDVLVSGDLVQMQVVQIQQQKTAVQPLVVAMVVGVWMVAGLRKSRRSSVRLTFGLCLLTIACVR